MTKEDRSAPKDTDRREPRRIRLPGFIPAGMEEVGLGDVIPRVTRAARIRPCGGCQRRASRLNGWMVFTR
jgi:hypothetical protein